MKTNKLGLTVQVWYGPLFHKESSQPASLRLETSDGRRFVQPGIELGNWGQPDDVKSFDDYEEMNLYIIEARQQFKLMECR